MSDVAVPPGWPGEVPPPGSERFERVAVGWLLDRSPPELRGDAVLRRHPVALARLTACCQAAVADGLREGVRSVRAQHSGQLDVATVAEVVEIYAREADRAARAAKAAEQIGAALAGRRWVPRL